MMQPAVFVSLLLLSLLAGGVSAQSTLVPLTKADKQGLLDAHNALRARTARGESGSQPSAADMMLLEWDERLSEKAATWASQCIAGHDATASRLIPGYSWVGQNWAGGWYQNLSSFVELWFGEYKDYTYNGNAGACVPGKMCGHYTQVVWSKSLLLGCAASTCTSYSRTLVCNYAQGGNFNDGAPYVSGRPASQCIGEYVYTRGSVCLRQDQCQLGDDASSCRCANTCQNGGSLDEGTCKCSCTPDYYGSRCEIPCTDPAEWRDSCQGDPDACNVYPTFCPRTCKQCIVTDIRDKAAVNSDGIVARVP